MSSRYDDYDRHICLIPIPSLSRLKRDVGIYISGGMFALGWWFFIDSVVYSSHLRRNGDDDSVPFVSFEDWLCGIFSTLGMIIVNLIDKSRLTSEYMGSGTATRGARLCLFVGFAAMAGGLAGSCVSISIIT
ncbi:4764_t:CDS:2 [Funneliformis geosporum]|uniref:7305_t:CDS:1 n=1 Tax=Funneliformis geosporum TaxID=1117311 RepID=A0A9W4SDG4_9GLOM|nr:4764_t:CDS:2 [Funneliformis geosporum]CAI2165022.1 7305_t:CDS:2 [Funneliformis geosporum]